MPVVSIHMPELSGVAGMFVFLRSEVDGALLNIGGDALTETPVGSSRFVATVAEAIAVIHAAGIYSGNTENPVSALRGGWIAAGGTLVQDAYPSAGAEIWQQIDIDYVLDQLALLSIQNGVVVVPMGSYMCARGDLEAVFGAVNVASWGDKNNNASAPEIDAAILYAISIADSMTRSQLYQSPYAMPVSGDEVPATLVYHVAGLAGVLLYENKGVIDFDPTTGIEHKLSFHRRRWEAFIAAVKVGAISLAPLSYTAASGAPEFTP